MIPEEITATKEAERALLGALLLESSVRSSTAMQEVRNLVKPEHFLDHRFYDNHHARIYQAMLSCEHPDIISVAREMNNQGTLRKGDCAYLRELEADCPCSLDYKYYAKVVADYALQHEVEYHTAKGNFDKARSLLNRRNKGKFTGGITV